MITDLEEWAQDNGYFAVWRKDKEGPIIALLRNPYNVQLVVCDEDFVNERYSYTNYTAALLGLVGWIERKGEGEPEGWIRHQPSNRRREGGDPHKETIRP